MCYSNYFNLSKSISDLISDIINTILKELITMTTRKSDLKSEQNKLQQSNSNKSATELNNRANYESTKDHYRFYTDVPDLITSGNNKDKIVWQYSFTDLLSDNTLSDIYATKEAAMQAIYDAIAMYLTVSDTNSDTNYLSKMKDSEDRICYQISNIIDGKIKPTAYFWIEKQIVKQNYISSDNSASDIKSEKDVGLKNLLHSLDC